MASPKMNESSGELWVMSCVDHRTSQAVRILWRFLGWCRAQGVTNSSAISHHSGHGPVKF